MEAPSVGHAVYPACDRDRDRLRSKLVVSICASVSTALCATANRCAASAVFGITLRRALVLRWPSSSAFAAAAALATVKALSARRPAAFAPRRAASACGRSWPWVSEITPKNPVRCARITPG